jgi:hypothetical protein
LIAGTQENQEEIHITSLLTGLNDSTDVKELSGVVSFLTFAELIKKSPSLHGIHRFIGMSTSSRYLTLLSADKFGRYLHKN